MEPKLGPTGEPASGSIPIPGDRGGLLGTLSLRGDRIVLDFGTSLSFVCMTLAEAREFGQALSRKAVELAAEMVDRE